MCGTGFHGDETAVTRGCLDGGCSRPVVFTPLTLRRHAAPSYDIDAPNITHMWHPRLQRQINTTGSHIKPCCHLTHTHTHTHTLILFNGNQYVPFNMSAFNRFSFLPDCFTHFTSTIWIICWDSSWHKHVCWRDPDKPELLRLKWSPGEIWDYICSMFRLFIAQTIPLARRSRLDISVFMPTLMQHL